MLTRRSLLGGALAALPLSVLWRRTSRAAGFGPLVPDPEGILDLPAGFSYRIVEAVSRGGVRQRMSDGFLVPGAPDGMACFPGPDGTIILLRNHELSGNQTSLGPYDAQHPAPAEAYDRAQLGGVSRVVLDGTTFERLSSNLVLAGTIRNCAGGTSPWGWLSCEENYDANHGYVFVCPTDASSVRMPQRVVGYGRFEHEAATVDPATMICYLTEDKGDSCFYRFVPTRRASPFVGSLQALRVVGRDRFHTGTGNRVGDHWQVDWVTIDTPDPVGGATTTRAQGRARGAAIFVRGEGLWLHDGSLYFTCTTGGPVSGGQIFRLDPSGDGGTLTLIAQSASRDELDMPDNLTVAPWDDIYIAEDGTSEQYLRIVHPDGSISDFARNALSGSELAGVCFSPDGRALFVNLQGDGLTLVVTGPFPTVPEPEPDAGVPDAAVPPPDAGIDAGPVDAGGPDAGAVPDGSVPSPDARPIDASVPAPDAGGGDGGGDGCSAGGNPGATAAILAAAAALGLRRGSDPGEAS
jgi:uncharacterized protein